MAVVLWKIDERLVHGQVVTSFGRYFAADEFIVVNDVIAFDDEQIGLMELAIDPGAELGVVTCKEFGRIVAENDFFGKKTIVVFRYLDDVMECVFKYGVKMPVLNCAGLFQRKDRPDAVRYNQNLYVTEEDKAKFRKLEDHGIKLVYQLTYAMKETALSAQFKY